MSVLNGNYLDETIFSKMFFLIKTKEKEYA
jgi:hypothetical protein